MRPEDIASARAHAEFFRLRGYAVLPGSMTEKKPLCRFKEYWDSVPPASLLDQFPTTNLHLICGRRWRLLVIDLDGSEAQRVWPTLGRSPKTWISHSGGNGQHWWYMINRDYPYPLKFAKLWDGGERHQRIDRLCDGSLMIAPPSIHVETGRRYVFERYCDPGTIPMPAPVPGWVLALKPLPSDKPIKPIIARSRTPLDTSQIPNKVRTACSWGLRITGSAPDAGGWIACRAVDRRDDRPSCSFHAESGVYFDHANNMSLSFIDLALALRAYPDHVTAIQDLKKLS